MRRHPTKHRSTSQLIVESTYPIPTLHLSFSRFRRRRRLDQNNNRDTDRASRWRTSWQSIGNRSPSFRCSVRRGGQALPRSIVALTFARSFDVDLQSMGNQSKDLFQRSNTFGRADSDHHWGQCRHRIRNGQRFSPSRSRLSLSQKKKKKKKKKRCSRRSSDIGLSKSEQRS